jgi:phenylacetate-CoA ligase
VEVHETGHVFEIGPVAASCERAAMHLLTSAYYIEVDRGAGALPLEDADRGRLVLTPLNWYSRAVLRYDTDRDVVIGHGCECGRLTPTVRLRSADDG